MITKELIERINCLAKKKRETGLTSEEEQEQSKLRRQYLDEIKDQIRPTLEGLKENPENIENANENHHHKNNCSCKDCKH